MTKETQILPCRFTPEESLIRLDDVCSCYNGKEQDVKTIRAALTNSVMGKVVLKLREILQTAKQEFGGAELDLSNYGHGDICAINNCYDGLLQLIDEALRELALDAWNTRTPAIADGADPDMPAAQIRLHFGELTNNEIRLVRAAIRFANSQRADGVGVDTLALSRFYIDMEPKYTPYTLDYFKVCLAELAAFFENNGYEIIRTPPQAATDEG